MEQKKHVGLKSTGRPGKMEDRHRAWKEERKAKEEEKARQTGAWQAGGRGISCEEELSAQSRNNAEDR
jgi:hypothetical protein